jgi:hypothetical protein
VSRRCRADLQSPAISQIASDPLTARLTVDLVAQTIAAAGQPTIHFDVEPRRKADLLDGVDEINRTMREERSINAFETRHRQAQPWIGEITIACCDVQLADHRVGFLHQNFRATPKFGPLPATLGKILQKSLFHPALAALIQVSQSL